MKVENIKNIIKESLIREVGDLRGIDFYKLNKIDPYKYTFDTDLGEVEIDFDKFIPSEWDKFEVNHNQFDYTDKIYNINYTIKGNYSQIEKTNYKELIKIIGTVVQATKQFVNEVNPYALVMFGMDKKGDFATDKQKNTLYLMLASKNKPAGYRISPATLVVDSDLTLDGYTLFKN